MKNKAILSLLLLVVVGALLGSDVWASHFRYSHVTWTTVGPNTAEFEVQIAYRRDAYRGTAPDGFPRVGDVIQDATLDFGDGTRINGVYFEVVSIDVPQNWLLGIGKLAPAAPRGIRHTYPRPTDQPGRPWVASVSGCCRLGAGGTPPHINNPDLSYRVETTVEFVTGNRPPRSGLFPIVNAQVGVGADFLVPAADPDGDRLRWRLATPAETGDGRFRQPGPPFTPTPLAVNPDTGRVTWAIPATTRQGLYSTQIVIEDLTPAGAVKSKVTVDFFIAVGQGCTNPPKFDVPPTPPNGSTVQFPVGVESTFVVQASDPDPGDTIRLNVVSLPPGATFPVFPALPPANPVRSTFTWRPTAAQVGRYPVTFSATDNKGCSTVHSVIVEVPAPALARLTIEKEATPGPTASPGSWLCYGITVTNIGTAAATNVVVTDTLPAGTSLIEAPDPDPPIQLSISADRRTLTWNLGRVEPGETKGVFFIIEIAMDYTDATLTNTATVRSPDADPPSVSTTYTTPVNPSGDVLTTELGSPALVSNYNRPITYKFTVKNDTESDYTNGVITSTLPARGSTISTFLSADSGGTLGPDGKVTWSVGTVPVGSRVTVSMTVQPPRQAGLLRTQEVRFTAGKPIAVRQFFTGLSCQGGGAVRVSQESSPGAGDFDFPANTLGYIDAYFTDKTASQFYDYNRDDNRSFNGTLPPWAPLMPYRSHLFLVRSSVDGLSLFVVHSVLNDDPNSNGRFSNEVRLQGTTGATFRVQDDPTEIDDRHQWLAIGSSLFLGQGLWTPGTTDGFVLGELVGNWKADIRFLGFDNLMDWYVYSGGFGPQVQLALEPDRRVRLEVAPPACGSGVE